MAYGTPDQLRKLLKAARADAFFAADDNAYLQELLDAAAGEINGELSGWYEVPVTGSALPQAQRDELLAMLAHWNCVIAAYNGIAFAAKDIPKGIRSRHTVVSSTLSTIRHGNSRLPYVAGIRRPRISVAGDRKLTTDARFFAMARMDGIV